MADVPDRYGVASVRLHVLQVDAHCRRQARVNNRPAGVRVAAELLAVPGVLQGRRI